ncbi:L,D-transpeptidase [Amycolatopsis cihanbeyliensis]|uniref:L,D-transpeptidase-like protein n=1 Tax=Amycolatopsis cihanbeyliensis TaxID=1128664 RepID=A0A542DLZ8_AMYCI|nr:L,D-transpeptidase [Amycolatopsis cihanbeyliensis]TQJ04117.1 L,D-transpeptidase-like protein [Amycolatopsis cihanbeyliensis]
MTALTGLIGLALLATGCGSEPQRPAVDPVAVSAEDLTKLPESTTYADILGSAVDDRSGTSTGEVLHPTEDLVVYAEIGGTAIAKLPSLQVGSPTWVPVIAEEGDWKKILLPSRPNGSAGWVFTGAAAPVETARNDYIVNIDLATFGLEIVHRGERAGQWSIGIGKPEYPTPEGRAYIVASVEETVNTYSPIVLPLSVHSDAHETFGDGPGTVGIHTWPDSSFAGKANSDGCVRVPKEALDRLVELPLGTIVNIA